MTKNLFIYTIGMAFGLVSFSSTCDAQGHHRDCSLHGQPPRAKTPQPRPPQARAPQAQGRKPRRDSTHNQRGPQNSQQIAQMVTSLRGSSQTRKSSRNLVQRSITVNPIAIPRGTSHYVAPRPTTYTHTTTVHNHSAVGDHQYPTNQYGYQGAPQAGGQFQYEVDHSCQLCTNEIKFLKNSTHLADQTSMNYLQSLAYALQDPALMHQRFVIEGHASAEGSYSANQVLSQRRANMIFDFLINNGVHPSRLLSVGHGEGMARYSANSAEYLRSTDRRVMVFKMAN